MAHLLQAEVPTFTLDQAILTALQRNPTLLNAEQEIKRTKGVIIQVRAQALPQVNAKANFEWTDPNLLAPESFKHALTGTTTRPDICGRATGSLVEVAAVAGRGRSDIRRRRRPDGDARGQKCRASATFRTASPLSERS